MNKNLTLIEGQLVLYEANLPDGAPVIRFMGVSIDEVLLVLEEWFESGRVGPGMVVGINEHYCPSPINNTLRVGAYVCCVSWDPEAQQISVGVWPLFEKYVRSRHGVGTESVSFVESERQVKEYGRV